MAWTLAQARIYLGLDDPETGLPGPGTDPQEDALIQTVLDEVQAAVERVLSRELFLARSTDTFYNVSSNTIQLPRPPIKTVHAIDYNGVEPAGSAFGSGTGNLQIHNRVGWLKSPDFNGRHEVRVDYEGGWEVLPLDLEQAMWSAFQTRYADYNQTTGAPPLGSGTTVVAGSGEVSRVTIQDFGTVTYDVGSTVSAGAQAAADAQAVYGWLADWADVWDNYRIGYAGAGLGLV